MTKLFAISTERKHLLPRAEPRDDFRHAASAHEAGRDRRLRRRRAAALHEDERLSAVGDDAAGRHDESARLAPAGRLDRDERLPGNGRLAEMRIHRRNRAGERRREHRLAKRHVHAAKRRQCRIDHRFLRIDIVLRRPRLRERECALRRPVRRVGCDEAGERRDHVQSAGVHTRLVAGDRHCSNGSARLRFGQSGREIVEERGDRFHVRFRRCRHACRVAWR